MKNHFFRTNFIMASRPETWKQAWYGVPLIKNGCAIPSRVFPHEVASVRPRKVQISPNLHSFQTYTGRFNQNRKIGPILVLGGSLLILFTRKPYCILGLKKFSFLDQQTCFLPEFQWYILEARLKLFIFYPHSPPQKTSQYFLFLNTSTPHSLYLYTNKHNFLNPFRHFLQLSHQGSSNIQVILMLFQYLSHPQAFFVCRLSRPPVSSFFSIVSDNSQFFYTCWKVMAAIFQNFYCILAIFSPHISCELSVRLI